MKVQDLAILEDIKTPENYIGGFLYPPPYSLNILSSMTSGNTNILSTHITNLDPPDEPGTLSIEGLIGRFEGLGRIRPNYRYEKTFSSPNGKTRVVSFAGSGQIGSSGVYSFASQSIRTLV